MKKDYKLGDYVFALNNGVEMIACIVSTPDEDDYDLELKSDEVGIEWQYEDVDGVEVIKVSEILRPAKTDN